MISQLGTSDKEPIFSINPVINEVATVKSTSSVLRLFTKDFQLSNITVRGISGYNKDNDVFLCLCEKEDLRFMKFLEKNKNFEFCLYESYFQNLNVLITDEKFNKINSNIYIIIFYTYNN